MQALVLHEADVVPEGLGAQVTVIRERGWATLAGGDFGRILLMLVPRVAPERGRGGKNCGAEEAGGLLIAGCSIRLAMPAIHIPRR